MYLLVVGFFLVLVWRNSLRPWEKGKLHENKNRDGEGARDMVLLIACWMYMLHTGAWYRKCYSRREESILNGKERAYFLRKGIFRRQSR